MRRGDIAVIAIALLIIGLAQGPDQTSWWRIDRVYFFAEKRITYAMDSNENQGAFGMNRSHLKDRRTKLSEKSARERKRKRPVSADRSPISLAKCRGLRNEMSSEVVPCPETVKT
ncbi:hypothetical protein KQX54_003466 [Cotesia glomerata]|uniref:Uncharacterized protein n=1 Tax=Cotesia glomerata TaxID=32391 RepID=A0AAV7HCD9_COTGL|nr:hypothetical protein KQX54_003466 [Cotesia glomerata]